MARCKECHAEILYIKTAEGMKPVNAEPVRYIDQENGDAEIITGSGRMLMGVVSKEGNKIGYVYHFSTCPKADWKN